MSRIKNIQLYVQTPASAHNETPARRFIIYVYAVNYNVFRIHSGMGGLGFQ